MRLLDSLLSRVSTGYAEYQRGVEVSAKLLEALRRNSANYEGDESLKCVPVLSAVRLLAETAAMVPLKLYRRTENGREEARNHETYRLVHDSPSPEWSSFEWRERMMLDLVIHGDHFSQLVLDGENRVREILPLNPIQMTPERLNDGNLIYKYSSAVDRQRPRTFEPQEILHVSLMRRYGDVPKGRSLVELAARAIGLSMNSQEFAAKFFENDAAPRLVLKSPMKLSPEKEKELKEQFAAAHAGVNNAHSIFVISGQNVELEVMQHDIEKLQLTATRNFQVSEVARIMRVPPHLLFDLTRSTFSNAENEMLMYQVFTAAPWFGRIAAKLNMHLLGPRERSEYYFEFDPDALVQADYNSRTEGMAREVSAALLMPDEARAKLNRPSAPGGDRLYIQGAMVPAVLAGEQLKQQPQGGQR